MIANADFMIQSPDSTPQLIVEAKTKTPASADWAARMRRNLFAHVTLPPARFFLLALPERFYLWKDALTSVAIPPDYEIDAQRDLEPYLRKLKIPLAQLSKDSFEILLRSWLEDLVQFEPVAGQNGTSDWLVESGLYDAIKQGSVEIRKRT